MITNLLKLIYVHKRNFKPRNMTNFSQKVKILKTFSRFRDVTLSKLYYNILKKSIFTSATNVVKKVSFPQVLYKHY